MKVRAIFSFCIIISLFLFFNSPLLEYFRKEIRLEMKILIAKSGYNKNDLVLFSEDNLVHAKWIDSKEFILNNTLYDLVYVKTQNNKKIYHCIKDHKETLIVSSQNFINSFWKTNSSNKFFAKPMPILKKGKERIAEITNFEMVLVFYNNLSNLHSLILIEKNISIDPLRIPPKI